MKKIIILFVTGTLLTACGIKGPPLPPLQDEETIQTQKPWVEDKPIEQEPNTTSAPPVKKKKAKTNGN